MQNKTIANWLMWSLIVMTAAALLEMSDELVGLLAVHNWAWVIVAIVRLNKIK